MRYRLMMRTKGFSYITNFMFNDLESAASAWKHRKIKAQYVMLFEESSGHLVTREEIENALGENK